MKYLKGKVSVTLDLTSTSNSAIQNAFYGLSTAVGEVGTSLKTGTGAIIDKKFGGK